MAKKLNAWMAHVQDVRAQNPGMSLMEILKKAKTTYKKLASSSHKKHGGSALGGDLSPSDVPSGGRSSGTALQIQATQFSGGKKSKRRGSGSKSNRKRSANKRSANKRSANKRSMKRGGYLVNPIHIDGHLKK